MLEGFYGSLDLAGQAMLGTIREGGAVGRYGWVHLQVQTLRGPDGGSTVTESQAERWNGLVGWREDQSEVNTQGIIVRKT